jgi:hypothetical protein
VVAAFAAAFVVFAEEPAAQDPSLAAWSAAVGFVLPLAIAVIQQRHWSTQLKSLVAFAICIIAAAVTVYFDGGKFDAGHLVESALIVFTLARASYAGLWKPIGVSDKIETKTTVTEPPPP